MPSTAHAVVPTTGLCALDRLPIGSHLQAVLPHAHREGFPLTGQEPSTAHEWVLKAVCCPQLHTKGSPPVGCAPSTTHGVVLTTRLFTLNSHEGSQHSRTACSLLGTVRSPLTGHEPSTGHGGVPTYGLVPSTAHAVVLPVGWAPSTAHGGDSTLGPLTLNWAWRGPDPWTRPFENAQMGPYS